MSSQFLYLGKASLPINGAVVKKDFGGEAFICTKGRGVFQVSFDGQSWSDWQKGLGAAITFSSLYFRSLPTATVATDIEFYYGTIPVSDSRLNVIDDAAEATIVAKPPGFTLKSVFNNPAGLPEIVTAPLNNPDDITLKRLRSIQWGFRWNSGGTIRAKDNLGNVLMELNSAVAGYYSGEILAGDSAIWVYSSAAVYITGGIFATYWND